MCVKIYFNLINIKLQFYVKYEVTKYTTNDDVFLVCYKNRERFSFFKSFLNK